MAKRIHRQEGFTLIELMIVILIIGILVGIAVPVFLAARGSAETRTCEANRRTVVSAANIYAAENEEYPTAMAQLYPNYIDNDFNDTGDTGGEQACPSDASADPTSITWGWNAARPPEPACANHP